MIKHYSGTAKIAHDFMVLKIPFVPFGEFQSIHITPKLEWDRQTPIPLMAVSDMQNELIKVLKSI